ncbi:hypothetical protein [Streptomyces sp. FIT100]|uniref:hypothetical protein n=1 Tax=Streptomyces sp. FIT100 TaxID=2837956 RepID=UPI0021C6E93F|nr:hypothetical protein [Streptomyces sp. FIT100]UUN28137.1 hypothetical protein KK483_18385 [Streptomyces sp. FIT100]
MKPMKVAAVVAGSLAVAGASAPAFAASGFTTPTSLNGAVTTVAEQTTAAAAPIASKTLDTEQQGSLLNSVKGATGELGKAKGGVPAGLLGGLPLGS